MQSQSGGNINRTMAGASSVIRGGGKPCLCLVLLCMIIQIPTAPAAHTSTTFAPLLLQENPKIDAYQLPCNQDETEWLMDSGTGRRLLTDPKYIGYGAIRQRQDPAIKPKAPGDPPPRVCNPIYGCRS